MCRRVLNSTSTSKKTPLQNQKLPDLRSQHDLHGRKVDIHWDEQRRKHKRHPHLSGSSNPHRFPKPFESKWFNTVAFVAQAANTLGNERRNQLSGLPQRALNVSVFRPFLSGSL